MSGYTTGKKLSTNHRAALQIPSPTIFAVEGQDEIAAALRSNHRAFVLSESAITSDSQRRQCFKRYAPLAASLHYFLQAGR